MSTWANVEKLPPDAIFFTKSRFQADTDPRKVNLGIGAYRDDEGKPYVLKIVRQMEREMLQDLKDNKEYLGIGGDPEFVKLSQAMILGKDNKAVTSGCIGGVQSLSGTGGVRLLFEFLQRNTPSGTKVYISNPTWGNHKKVIKNAGFEFEQYRYWDASTRALNLKGMLEDLNNAPQGSIILLHTCAHNPTGVDPTVEQWAQIAEVCKAKKFIPFFDTAYQGYATGNLEGDAASVRYFVNNGLYPVIAQSYAKNMGLYGERVGCASVVTATQAEAEAVTTQLCAIIRPMYSNPPKHGMLIAKRILSNPEYFAAWVQELKMMSNRIISVRAQLRQELEKLGTPGTWNHITDQIGMFTFTGLTPPQVEVMEKKHHIYLLSNGRVSMAGVSSKNVKYIAAAMDDVVRNIKSRL